MSGGCCVADANVQAPQCVPQPHGREEKHGSGGGVSRGRRAGKDGEVLVVGNVLDAGVRIDLRRGTWFVMVVIVRRRFACGDGMLLLLVLDRVPEVPSRMRSRACDKQCNQELGDSLGAWHWVDHTTRFPSRQENPGSAAFGITFSPWSTSHARSARPPLRKEPRHLMVDASLIVLPAAPSTSIRLCGCRLSESTPTTCTTRTHPPTPATATS